MRPRTTLLSLAAALALASPALGQGEGASSFVCGDLNGDTVLDVSDSIHLLRFLFLGADPPQCGFLPPDADLGEGSSCDRLSAGALESCRHQRLADYWLARARCETLADPGERQECGEEAREEIAAELEGCEDMREARVDLCGSVSALPYEVEIDADDFADGVENPYFPLVPGTTLVYEQETDEGLERVEVTVTGETREILGVDCTVVRDTVALDGELVEDTYDWFATDREGNVWYFGELSFEYEDGEISALEGSWEAGLDGAHPGIVMKAQPEPGDVYFQEFFLGEAEDAGRVLALGETVTVPAGTFEGCLQTADFTPLEPDVLEHKYYAPGVGVVLEVDLEEDTRLELVEIRRPAP